MNYDPENELTKEELNILNEEELMNYLAQMKKYFAYEISQLLITNNEIDQSIK